MNYTAIIEPTVLQRYSVIPLSQNSGLIGWLPTHDTIHQLLREYRDKRKIMLNIEHKLMQKVGANFMEFTNNINISPVWWHVQIRAHDVDAKSGSVRTRPVHDDRRRLAEDTVAEVEVERSVVRTTHQLHSFTSHHEHGRLYSRTGRQVGLIWE